MTVATQPRVSEFYAKPESSLGYLCRIGFRNFSRVLEKRTLPMGVTAGQWRFLRVLWAEDGLSQRELSRRVGMREPTTVVALKSLEKSGYIRRVPNTVDRRITNVFVTQSARDLELKLLPFVAEVNDMAIAGLSQAEVDQLRTLLCHVIDNLQDEADSVMRRAGPE
ncbi:MarR family winged helix-turn-helix transcriptional regulator [Novosphingobium sp.]|uniref:MarR family winged helix-turn-helix transcriptional regulator n=1 Tax=Novosphingobium sp. TaxID=1874826 RepID=UPI0027327191|nr:MarR family transcriptional regulator [Novosphingobium sp.]MDP3908575.1 MarR family transcriptional regulator [Novosphingobium sp.]